MKRFFSHTLYWLFWSVLLLSSGACRRQGGDELRPNETLSLALKVQDSKVLRQGTATSDETKIDNIMILFFETTGQQKLWKNKIYEYDATATGLADGAKWEDGQTMLFPLSPEEVGTKKVVVVANYKGKGNLETKLRAVQKFGDFSDATKQIYYDSADENSKITAPLLLMEGSVVHTFTKVNRKAQVVLNRAVAKVTVKLDLRWGPLDARRSATTERSFYQFRDVAKRTHVVEHANLLLNASNRSERYNDNPAMPLLAENKYMWEFAPVTDHREGPFVVTAYINEYNQGTDKTNVPPYLYLALYADVPESHADDPEGKYPPPAGGDIYPAHKGYYYYRVILPREVKRNTHYILESQVLSAGSGDAAKPVDLSSNVSIKEWSEVNLSGKGEEKIYN
ncbi:fimbrial protein [Porphyromonas endodontalis]|uniref:fimbrial protein n=1 Tax=Porphyromonas endodontalis TaxID=28124 RepID=UPI0023F17787|nr:fimbrial protein [Porphyromonas endodontalis]